jgi:hypothetical protein
MDASENITYGPAFLFESGPVNVSTQGTQATGAVTTTATLTAITNANGETMTADSLSSTCTANGTNSAATIITNGVVDTSIDETTPTPTVTTEPLPPTPGPNFTVNGTLKISASDTETYSWIFNEQISNRDGSVTVNAAHYELHGPTAIGDIYIGQSTCGFPAAKHSGGGKGGGNGHGHH